VGVRDEERPHDVKGWGPHLGIYTILPIPIRIVYVDKKKTGVKHTLIANTDNTKGGNTGGV